MPQKGGGLLAKYGLSRNPFTDRTAEKTDLVSSFSLSGVGRYAVAQILSQAASAASSLQHPRKCWRLQLLSGQRCLNHHFTVFTLLLVLAG